MRLPYTPQHPNPSTPAESAIVQNILTRRGSRGLIALDRTLLHSPPIADGWNSFLGAIRTGTALPTDIREIAICRIAVLNGAWYEWEAHAPIARGAGVSDSALDSLRQVEGREGREAGKGPEMEELNEKQRIVVVYTDAMTRDVKVLNAVFEKLREVFNEREVVEITATVAAYNCVSRFLVALDVGEMNDKNEPLQ
ncbi:hypothetical protein MMC30_000128 [Trapelia coarctata]|nr:hypothetical protein [Trapelia coarctata]